MGSQLNMQATNLKPDLDSFEYPLIHAGAFPIQTSPAADRPHKRIRLATRPLSSVNTNISPDQRWQETASPPNSATFIKSPLADHGSSSQGPALSHSTSVPTEQPKRGRRRKHNPQVTQSDPFILEHMPFPEHQPWLEVKPRQRKAAVPVGETTSIFPPESEAPDEGEALVLDKHADRIAALIAQKRRDNDSKQFRQRMALQQRLHRGEQDEQDKVIAASHDELKRKMELSAQGIFEQNPPDGTEMGFRASSMSSAGSADDIEQRGFASDNSSRQDTAFSGDMHHSPELNHAFGPLSIDASDSSDVDEGYAEQDFNNTYDSQPPILGGYVHYSQREYYQHTVLTNRLLSINSTAHAAHNVENTYSPPSYATQYADTSQNWNPAQPWTTQMYHALPSTQTPELERAEVPQARQRMASYDAYSRDASLHAVRQPHDNYDYYASVSHSVSTTNTSSSSSTPAIGVARMNHQVTLPSSSTPAADSEGSNLRSNVNMFTRQARENGVIGGNNNVIIPPAPRRNMFDRS